MASFSRELARSGQTIVLQSRDIQAPAYNQTQFTQLFQGDTATPAIICTDRGSTLFDGVGVDNPITHIIHIAYQSGVTSETWILLSDGRRLDILDVENKNERNVCLILRCADRGIKVIDLDA